MLFLFPRLKGTITTEILVFCFFRKLHCFPIASGHKIVNTVLPVRVKRHSGRSEEGRLFSLARQSKFQAIPSLAMLILFTWLTVCPLIFMWLFRLCLCHCCNNLVPLSLSITILIGGKNQNLCKWYGSADKVVVMVIVDCRGQNKKISVFSLRLKL